MIDTAMRRCCLIRSPEGSQSQRQRSGMCFPGLATIPCTRLDSGSRLRPRQGRVQNPSLRTPGSRRAAMVVMVVVIVGVVVWVQRSDRTSSTSSARLVATSLSLCTMVSCWHLLVPRLLLPRQPAIQHQLQRTCMSLTSFPLHPHTPYPQGTV